MTSPKEKHPDSSSPVPQTPPVDEYDEHEDALIRAMERVRDERLAREARLREQEKQ